MSDQPPFVSAILLSFNCAKYIRNAVRSTVNQDFDAYEVVISDDASDDRTFAIIEDEVNRCGGSVQTTLRRRSVNSGSKSAHLNDVIKHTAGEIVVFFDGDDMSRPHRLRRIAEVFRQDPDVTAVYSSYALIDPDGNSLGPGRVPHPTSTTNTKTWFANVNAYASGGTLAVRNSVFEHFGPLDPDIHEDVVLPFRASLLGEVRYLDEDLVDVRRHTESFTQGAAMFASLDAYRARFLWGISQAERHCESRARDLECILTHFPERTNELHALRHVIQSSMADAEASAGLVSPSIWIRIQALVKLLLRGAAVESLGRNLFLVFAPESYLRIKRNRLRKLQTVIDGDL